MKEKIKLDDIIGNTKSVPLMYSEDKVKKFMREAIRQALELAAENAKPTYESLGAGSSRLVVDKQSILNTINSVE